MGHWFTKSSDAAPIPTPSVAPKNLHLAVSCPQSGQAPPKERVEQKFFIAPGKADRALALLWRTCRFDPEYPSGQVNSLYFDSPDLDQHERSVSGDFAKDKIRIRWYGEELDPHRTRLDRSHPPGEGRAVRVWLELKSRKGFASTKQRLTLEVDSATLAFAALQSGIVPAQTLFETLAAFGFFPRGPLVPTVAISYARYRFIEPQTGFRVSFDSRIRSSLIVRGVGIGERGLELPGAVIEVKGPDFGLPASLRPLADMGSSWTRYSKYSSSLDGHAEPRASVSRLWPSGLMEERPGSLAPVRPVTFKQRPAAPVLAYDSE